MAGDGHYAASEKGGDMTVREVREQADPVDIIEIAPDGIIVVDRSGQVVLVNRQLEKLFGYERAELLGQTVEVLLPERFRDSHRDHRATFAENPRVRALGTARALFGQRKDGTEFSVDISLSPIQLPDGDHQTIVTIRDITERLTLVRDTQVSLHAFQTAFEAAPVGMAMVNFDDPVRRQLTKANDALCEMLGYSRDELLTKGFAELTYSEDSAESDRSAQAAVEGEVSRYGIEKRYIHNDGHLVWAWVHSAVVPPVEGTPQQVLVHVADLTERKQVEANRKAQERVRVLEDRERLAAELHDVIIQKLFATGMGLQAAQSGTTDEVLRERIGDSVRAIDDTIAELRSAIFRLDSPAQKDPRS